MSDDVSVEGEGPFFLIREDFHYNAFYVDEFEKREDAQKLADEFNAKGHKQTFSVVTELPMNIIR